MDHAVADAQRIRRVFLVRIDFDAGVSSETTDTSTHSGCTSNVLSATCVAADFRCRQPCVGTACTCSRGPTQRAQLRDALGVAARALPDVDRCGRRARRRRRRACPAPRSRAAAGSAQAPRRPMRLPPRREAAPGRVITATSSSTTAMSSTNTASGMLVQRRQADDVAAEHAQRPAIGLRAARRRARCRWACAARTTVRSRPGWG